MVSLFSKFAMVLFIFICTGMYFITKAEIYIYGDNQLNNQYYAVPQVSNNYSYGNNNTQIITVPANLTVPFQVQGNYNSKTLTQNTKITVIISNDVYYDNIVVFKRGTVGYLYPSYVNKAGRLGDQAQININSVVLRSVDGKEQTLAVEYSTNGKNVVWAPSAGFFSKNKEIELNSGTILYGKTINTFPLYINNLKSF